VIPGSHHPQFGEALRGLGATCLRDPSLPAHVVATEPGDMLLLDERVLHNGPDWRRSSRKAVARLEALGVYELAAAQEAFM
jgi:hypothetical protein